MNTAAGMRTFIGYFLAAYTAVNRSLMRRMASWVFLAAYTAVNVMAEQAVVVMVFLAAYTAVN